MDARRTDMHRLQEVVRLHRLGRSRRVIARQLQMGRDTIRSYLAALEAAELLEGAIDALPDLDVLRRAVESQLDEFDWAFNPQVPKAKIVDLATCHFVERRESVLLVGPTGVGKSHIAQALGERACRAGYSVLYTPAHRMLSQLRAARADQTHEKKMLRFTSPDVLIVDDLGLRPLDGDEPIDLYEVIRARYERGAMIVTSNRAIEEWYPLFRDDLMASAAMDRLLHHAHVVVMEGTSFRNPARTRRAS